MCIRDSDLKNPKKRKNSRVNNLTREIAHAQKLNPLSDLDEILHNGRYPRRNHVGKFWWRSVKGFRGDGGSNFGLSHWHWLSSLQHSRTTLRVCDTACLKKNSHNLALTCALSNFHHFGQKCNSDIRQPKAGLFYNLAKLELLLVHCVPKNLSTFYFLNNTVKN